MRAWSLSVSLSSSRASRILIRLFNLRERQIIVTGAKSEDDSRLASRKYAHIVQKLGSDAKLSDFKTQNIVGSCDVKFPIRLEGLVYSHG